MKILFFETVKSKVIISLSETVKLSVSISQRNLYNSLKSIKEKQLNNRVKKGGVGEGGVSQPGSVTIWLLLTPVSVI